MIKILHISDLHFGPFHWDGNDDDLIEKINSYKADLVFNTGDSTSDGIEREYLEANVFLKKIKCANIISIPGNHDKRSRSSVEFFKKNISNPNVIYPDQSDEIKKKYLFLDDRMKLKEKFTDINFIKRISIQGENILVICLDSNVLYQDNGFVEESILKALSRKLNNDSYEQRFLLIHHSVMATDESPLVNSQRVIDFITFNKINYVFCGHTHEIDFRISKDIPNKHQFFQLMSGATACNDMGHYGKNVFVSYEFEKQTIQKINIVKVYGKKDRLVFQEERII